MKPLGKKINQRIRRRGRGWVFTPKDFLDLGSRAAVDQVLCRSSRAGNIRRIDRGIYDFPVNHPVLGLLLPPPDKIAAALARQTGDSIQPTGARAANMLGLSTQVPAKPVYLTSGPSKTRKIGAQTIQLKHTAIRIAPNFSDGARLAVQAMLHLGKHGVDNSVVHRLQNTLAHGDKQHLMRVIGVVPDWLVPAMKEIAA